MTFVTISNSFGHSQKCWRYRAYCVIASFIWVGLALLNTLPGWADSYRFSPASGQMTSPFGWRSDPMTGKSRFHGGIDIAASFGAPVFVPQDGIVAYSGPYKGYGNVVVVDHGQKLRTLYAHNADLYVYPGQGVKRGQVIARIGSTGRSTGPHLHFEVHVANKYVNPLEYLTYLEHQHVAPQISFHSNLQKTLNNLVGNVLPARKPEHGFVSCSEALEKHLVSSLKNIFR
jgi:murein DD-endopeptidase MepM/ murein hydrolase activator NlpD